MRVEDGKKGDTPIWHDHQLPILQRPHFWRERLRSGLHRTAIDRTRARMHTRQAEGVLQLLVIASGGTTIKPVACSP